ncbi:MAG TPA: hypothetical protein VLT57_08195, partial [Bryobacteraceae bacterium]|nr:hypothetical protein [Bryobacteraceae bacterium]
MTVEQTEVTEGYEKSTGQTAPPGNRRGLIALCVLGAVAGLLGLAIYSGINARAAASDQLSRVTEQSAIPVVNVVYPQAAAPTQEIVLPGNMQAFTDSPIYARTSGYLTHWYFDIG